MQSITGGEAVLTDLCAICHVNPLKYTCPRCGVHTCSLPCVKRHKQWAQCSGVRDPAEYRRRAELATPSSIDKDYNFITKVERTLQRADDIVVDKAIDLSPARTRWHDTKSKLEQEMEIRGIKIIKAPKGLSRSKQNKTHWAGTTKCVMWTIEWISPDGQKQISNTHETKTIGEAYSSVFGKKGHNLKRKRAQEYAERTFPVTRTVNRSGSPSLREDLSGHENQTSNDQKEEQTAADSGRSPSVQAAKQEKDIVHDSNSRTTSNTNPHPTRTSSLEASKQSRPKVTTASTNANVNAKSETEQPLLSNNSLSGLNFYLHRPNTEARYKCLIPLPQSMSLREALDNRTLLEFPTIHVRTETPEQLREPFITEDEYKMRHGVDIPINVAVPVPVAVEEGLKITHGANVEEGELAGDFDEDEGTESTVPVDLSEAKVMEVLAKDLG